MGVLNHTRVSWQGRGGWRGQFFCKWKFPDSTDRNLFVLLENQGDCNRAVLFSHSVCSIPHLMQMVILLNRKVVSGLQRQYLGTPHPQVSCEGLRLLHWVAWLAGSPHSKTTARTVSWAPRSDFRCTAMGVMWLGLHIQSSIFWAGRSPTNECPRKIRRWFLWKHLPLRLLKLPSKPGTCFSDCLGLSFHHTH